MRLLLFDIDGTLLRTNGVGRRAVEKALSDALGFPITTDGVTFSGRTDPQIIRDVLTRSGAEARWLEDGFVQCMRAFETVMEQTLLPETVRALPGAIEAVEELSLTPRYQLALLTGNLRPMAYRKLAAIRIDHHFPFGAFGCDHEDRNRLPAVAAARARRHLGRPLDPRDVVVIGDTPRDIECARAFGAHALAVATGNYSREALAGCGADRVLDDLTTLAECLETLR